MADSPTTTVFVYGTLRDDELVAGLLARYSWCGDAVLEGLHRVEGHYPTLAPGGSVTGRLLETPGIEPLDRYEGVDRGLYVRVELPLADGSASVYVGDPDAIDAPADWPGTGPFADRVEGYLEDHDVRVRRQ